MKLATLERYEIQHKGCSMVHTAAERKAIRKELVAVGADKVSFRTIGLSDLARSDAELCTVVVEGHKVGAGAVANVGEHYWAIVKCVSAIACKYCLILG